MYCLTEQFDISQWVTHTHLRYALKDAKVLESTIQISIELKSQTRKAYSGIALGNSHKILGYMIWYSYINLGSKDVVVVSGHNQE